MKKLCVKKKVSLFFLQDMRRHVMMTLLDTEQSYVESLRSLIQVTRTVPLTPPTKKKHEFIQTQTCTQQQSDVTQVKLKFEPI